MIPVLTYISDIVGIIGGAFVSTYVLGINGIIYRRTVIQALTLDILKIGLIKPFFFAAIIILVGAYTGLSTKGGTEGVGKSTTLSVVISSIMILVSDYFLTQFLIYLLGIRY
jgi:phospholipid/cholesterol/gamma-HCH transport system permease protein